MSDYGGIEVDGWPPDLTITNAPDVAGISVAVLAMDAGTHYRTDPDGNLIILGQLTYRPIRFDQDGRVIVCQRIQDPT